MTVEVSIILDTGFFSMDTLKILSTDTQPYLFVISAEVTVVTVFILPFDILEVLPLGVLPAVGLEKPLSHSGLAQYQRYGGEKMREVGHHHHARMDLKK